MTHDPAATNGAIQAWKNAGIDVVNMTPGSADSEAFLQEQEKRAQAKTTTDPYNYSAGDAVQQSRLGTDVVVIPRSGYNGASLGFDPGQPDHAVNINPHVSGQTVGQRVQPPAPRVSPDPVAPTPPMDLENTSNLAQAAKQAAATTAAPVMEEMPEVTEWPTAPPQTTAMPQAVAQTTAMPQAVPQPVHPSMPQASPPIYAGPSYANPPQGWPQHQPQPQPPQPTPAVNGDELIRKLGFSFLTGEQPSMPGYTVHFNTAMGSMSAHYHEVCRGAGCVALVFDRRAQHCMQFVPPVLGETAINIAIHSPDGRNAEMTCCSVGFTFALGPLDVIVLLDAADTSDS